MNIAINTLSVTPQRGGAKTYLVNIVKSLADVDKDNSYYLMVSPINEALFKVKSKNFKKITLPLYSDNIALRLLLEQFLIYFYTKKYKIDVLFSPGNFSTLFPGCRQVLVMQNSLIIGHVRKEHVPNEASFLRNLGYNLMFPLSIKSADKIIAVSHDIKKHLLSQMTIPEQKIQVVYEGVDMTMNKDSGTMPMFPKPYILFLSTLFKYKKLDRLLMAFVLLKKDYNIPHFLVVVGRDPKGEIKNLKRIVERERLSEQIIFAGVLPHNEIEAVYKNADVFVYPSAVESFGLPVLEAMACGTPVVASNRMSVPEICGDAALIVDPDNVMELADAIYRAVTDETLRKTLARKGLERVRKFTWKKAAQETIEVFKEIHSSA